MKELPPGKDALAQTCRTSCSYDTPWNLGAPGCFQEGPKQSKAKSTGGSILRASPVLGSLHGLLYLVGIWANLDYWDISSFPRKLLEESPEAVSEALDLIPQYICVMPDKACSHHLTGSWKHLQRRLGRDFFVCLFVHFTSENSLNWFVGSPTPSLKQGWDLNLGVCTICLDLFWLPGDWSEYYSQPHPFLTNTSFQYLGTQDRASVYPFHTPLIQPGITALVGKLRRKGEEGNNFISFPWTKDQKIPDRFEKQTKHYK